MVSYVLALSRLAPKCTHRGPYLLDLHEDSAPRICADPLRYWVCALRSAHLSARRALVTAPLRAAVPESPAAGRESDLEKAMEALARSRREDEEPAD